MPRGPVSGATAALIQALARRGVAVSRYQIERWRATGELPRPARHGLGRGRGVVSEPPDEATVQRAIILATSSRRGARRFGAHPIERVALGLPVPEEEVRQAVDNVLAQVGRMAGADLVDGDAGWQARQDIAARAARDFEYFSWQELVDAVDGAPTRPDPPRGRRRAAAAGLIHAMGGGDEAVGEELIEMLGLVFNLPAEQAERLHRERQAAELAGHDPWEQVAQQISVRNLREVANAARPEDLQRGIAVVATVTMLQTGVLLFGVLDLAGRSVDLSGSLMHFDGATLRRVQADPMWPEASMYRLSSGPKQRVRQLVLAALALLMTGRLEAWEDYRDRLLRLGTARARQL